ncbi:MAG TPA: carboxypeptidase regulatory-like domain-containing protein, partial [Candidatus Dormibacteraeota bacterium]
MYPRELSTSQNGRRRWTSGVVAAIALASVSFSVAGAIWHAPTVYAAQYSSAVLADSPSDYWPADEGSGTVVNESPTVGSRSLAFDNTLNWFLSGMVTGSNSAIQGGCVNPCPPAWLTAVPAPLPAIRSEEIWYRSVAGSVTSPQGLISVRQPQNGSGGCSESHTDVVLEPNPSIRVDSLDCNVGEFATDCTFGQNGVPNLLDQLPHLIDVTENNGTVTIYVDAHVCATGSGANVAISAPDCVAIGAIECTNGAFPLGFESVVGQAALYPTALTVAQISNHFNSGHAVTGPLAVYAQALGATTGKSFSSLVATFSDPSPSTNLSDYTSNIDWGDGTNNAGSIVLNSTGGIINGSHTYAGAGLFTIRVTVTKVGSTPVVGSNVARVTTHYQVMIQGWIPQPFVVYPLLPVEGLNYLFFPVVFDGNCITINDVQTALRTTVTTLMSGDNHTAFNTKGSFRVMGALDFDWDGVSIKNSNVSRGEGASHKVKFYWTNGVGPARCQFTKTESDADTTANVTGANTFSLNIGLKAGKNPFTPEAATPSIINSVIGTVNGDGSLKLQYATTGFPSLAVQVTRNGVVADTDITNDVSCLSNSDVRGPGGAAILLAGLSFPWTSGTETVAANAVGLSRTNYGFACVFRDAASSSQISGGASIAPAGPASTSTSHKVSLGAQSAGASSTATASGSSTGAISGKVTDGAGSPLSKICVRATGPLASAPTATATTGSAGTYTLTNLPAGTYDVGFEECGGGAHVTQWYEGKATQASADLVPVSAGITTAFINASLSLGSSIAGTIRNQSGAKVAGICAHAEDAGGHLADALASSSTGAYHLGGLLAGSYRITYSDCSNGDYLVNTPAAVVNISSTVGTITLDATMTLGGRITGNITDAAGHALSNVCPVAFTTGGAVAGLGSTTSSYTIHALAPGAFKVRFADCSSGIHVAQYWNNKSSFASATLVNVTAGATTSSVNARMATGGTIAGTIRDAAGAALAGACATAQSATGGESSGTSPITVTSGAYTISGLATDQYVVEFFDCTGGNHLPRWFNNKPDAGSADQVHVVAGSATS